LKGRKTVGKCADGVVQAGFFNFWVVRRGTKQIVRVLEWERRMSDLPKKCFCVFVHRTTSETRGMWMMRCAGLVGPGVICWMKA